MKRLELLLPAALLTLIVSAAAAAPALPLSDPLEINLSCRLEAPSGRFPCGTDELGRDLLSRMVFGSALSLKLTVLSLLFAIVFGGFMGGLAGYSGGITDYAVTRVIDVLLALPGILLAILIVAFFEQGELPLVMALTLTSWIGYARTSRVISRSLRKADFVEASLAMGAGRLFIWKQHLFPGLLPVLATQAAVGAAGIIMTESGLSFLGLGIAPPAPTIGGILSTGCDYMLESPHMVIFPSLYLFALLWSLYRLSDLLREKGDTA